MLTRYFGFVGWIAILWVLGACSADAYVGDDFLGDSADGGSGGEGGEEGEPKECAGVCLPRPIWGWGGPVALWLGPEDELPVGACDGERWSEGFSGFLDPGPQPPATCPQCTCELPPQVCTPGTDWMVHSETGCAGTTTDFSAPAGWNGACTEENAIPEGQLCDGKPCVRSVLIPPPELSSCVPRVDTSPTGEMSTFPTEETVYAHGCNPGIERGPCSSGDCYPALPAGFMACVYLGGLHPCLDENYPKQYLLFDHFEDTRGCSECTCGTPTGAKCSMNLQAYVDPVCNVNSCATTIGLAEPALCVDVMEGIALASKSAKIISSTPGVCGEPGGGEPIGELTMLEPITACCR